MVILGIDPGLAHTGWGVVETRGTLCRARAYGCVATKAHDPLPERLGAIHRELAQVIERFHPTDVAIEQIFFGQNTKSAIATAHARGAALVACATAGCAIGEYTPMQIKQAVAGTGAVLALDHDPKPDHCADALAAAVCHAHLERTLAKARVAVPR